MDQFAEQLVALPRSPFKILLQLLIGLAGTLCVAFCILFSITWGTVASIALPVALGFGALTVLLVRKLGFVEYEYTITNDIFDVDKIIAKRRRKRLLSFSLTNVEAFEPFHPASPPDGQYKRIRLYGKEFPPHYFIIRHKEFGKTMVVISPNEKVLHLIKQQLPRTVTQYNRYRY